MDKCGKEFVFISQQQASFHLFGTVDLLFISLLRLLRLKHSFPWSPLLLICWAPRWTRIAAAPICFGARSSIVLTVLLFSLRVSRHSCESLTVSGTIRAQTISFSFFAARQEEVVVCAFTCKIELIFSFSSTRVQHGDKIDEKDKIKCPEGWEWTSNWEVDDNRAVDDEGEILLTRNSLTRTK